MSRPPRVVNVEHLGDYRLQLTLSDNLVRELDLDGALDGEVFEPLRDRTVFAQVSMDTVAGTICWPNGVDIDPDVLHGDREPATGHGPILLKEYHLRPTG